MQPSFMPELGKTLSQARVARGLSLEDAERDTRISKRYLDALEREDWKVFPAPVYSRAFLRTYAQYLGLNPSELMRAFQTQTEEPEFKPLPEVRPTPATGSMNWVLAAGVLVFLAIAGILVYVTSGGGDGSTPSADRPVAQVTTEAVGGGPQPAVGKPIGEVKKGTVPDLKDVRLDDAITAIGQAGMTYVVVETDKVTGTPGVVAAQDPEPGTKGGGTTAVTLVVPRG
jgi:transcriptional regulator with XRE-family HTH domain